MKQLLGWLSLAILVAACQRVTPQLGTSENTKPQYTHITAEQLAQMMQNKDFLLINVHIPYEGDLPQTDLTIPYHEIEQHLEQLPDRNAKIVLYCRSGGMSTSVAEKLVELGYTQVFELAGGMNAWIDAGYQLINQ